MTETKTRIMVVDDDVRLRDLLNKYLAEQGFAVRAVANSSDMDRYLARERYDLLILDLMMPGEDGLAICRRLRGASENIPIIMLTAKDDEVDTVIGLELGADDYVTKPYSARELLARIKAVLRRKGDFTLDEGDSSIVQVGQIKLDAERHIVTFNGESVLLPLKEFELLEYLMRNAGRVLTRIQIIDRIWGSDYVGDTKTLDVHIKRLRSKFRSEEHTSELQSH